MLPDYTDAKSMAQISNEFFVTKIANIRTLLAALDAMLCPSIDSLLTPSTSKLQCFRPTNALEITEIVKNIFMSCQSFSFILGEYYPDKQHTLHSIQTGIL